MKLIADSGSTKTHWCVIENTVVLKHIYTKGINPFYQTEDEIQSAIDLQLMPEMEGFQIDEIFYYGTGCSFPEKKAMVSRALGHHFKGVVIQIESDLLGAARALFGQNRGIACILGTGSNSCLYDGENIVENVSPLGYMLGDEGSGAVLGKKLVADCLKNQLTPELKAKFMTQYELTPEIILENVYKKPFPNRFLAAFAPFLLQNIEEPVIFNLVYDSFDEFFVRNVMQYPLEGLQVGFIGSVSFHFKDTLEIVASERGMEIAAIEQSPMEGLVRYHK